MEALALLKIAKKQKAAEEEKKLEDSQRKVATRTISPEEQRKLNKLFGLPDAPVGLESLGKGGSASLWWSLEDSTADVNVEPYIIFELGLDRDLVENWKMRSIALARDMNGIMPKLEWSVSNKSDLEHNSIDLTSTEIMGKKDDFEKMNIYVTIIDAISGVIMAQGEKDLKDFMYEAPPPPPTPPSSDDEKEIPKVMLLDEWGEPLLDADGNVMYKDPPKKKKKKKKSKNPAKEKLKERKRRRKLAFKRKKKEEKERKKAERRARKKNAAANALVPLAEDIESGLESGVESGMDTSIGDLSILSYDTGPEVSRPNSPERPISNEAHSRPKSKDKKHKSKSRPKSREKGGKSKSKSKDKSKDKDELKDNNINTIIDRPGTADSIQSLPSVQSSRPSTSDSVRSERSNESPIDEDDPYAIPDWTGTGLVTEDWMADADEFDANGIPYIYDENGMMERMYAPPPPPPDPFKGMDLEINLIDPKTDEPAGLLICGLRREKILSPDDDDFIPENESDEQREIREKALRKKKKAAKKAAKKRKKEKEKERKALIAKGVPLEDLPPENDDLEVDMKDPNAPTDFLYMHDSIRIPIIRKVHLAETIISWEILRYRKDANDWNYKGTTEIGVLEKYQYLVEHLTDGYQYRFTVKARNRIGLSPESSPSNPVMVEQHLPSGWFRFYNPERNRFYYANMKTKQSSWKRPEEDPWFLEESIMLMFDSREISFLKELYTEEMVHFDKVTSTRYVALMKECGESLDRRRIVKYYRNFVRHDDELKTWQHFMLITSHVKKKKSEPAIPQPPAGCLFFLSRRVVAALKEPESRKFGVWRTEFNDIAEREYYVNSKTGEQRWEMPDEVRFYLPSKLEDLLLESFNYGHIENFKLQFSQIDVDGTGDISDTEMRILLENMGIKINDATFKRLLAVVDLNGNGTIEFDEFCWLMHSLSKKDKTGIFADLDKTDSRRSSSMMMSNQTGEVEGGGGGGGLDIKKISEGATAMMLQEIGEPAFDNIGEDDLELRKGGLLEDSLTDSQGSLYTIANGGSNDVISTSADGITGNNIRPKRRGSIMDTITSGSNNIVHSLSSNLDKARRRASVAVKKTTQNLTKKFIKQFSKSTEHAPDCFCGCRG